MFYVQKWEYLNIKWDSVLLFFLHGGKPVTQRKREGREMEWDIGLDVTIRLKNCKKMKEYSNSQSQNKKYEKMSVVNNNNVNEKKSNNFQKISSSSLKYFWH